MNSLQDPNFKRAVHGVVQGNPGAVDVLHGLKMTLPEADYIRVVGFLYERGPHADRLVTHAVNSACGNMMILGRELLAQANEWRGWN